MDGFISGVAALAALHMQPSIAPALLLTHASAERGGALLTAALQRFGLPPPPLQAGLRLGEATGALAAVPFARAAVAILCDMGSLEATLALDVQPAPGT